MSMKPKASNPRAFGSNSALPTELPIAWMDPMSWRLPSGKALAEFALQSGFLAPLLLGIDARRYLGFRSLCRAAETGETILLEHALAAYALVVDAQLALRTAL